MIKNPRILEIGVDKGQTAIPLLHNMCLQSQGGDYFKYVGIDVRHDITLQEQIGAMKKIVLFTESDDFENGTMTLTEDALWNTAYLINNSLNVLPMLEGLKFDVIMIDGDHNYATVSKELKYIEKLCFDSTIIVVDDYNGRWSDKDLHYKERDSHNDIDSLEKLPDVLDKRGVKAAVDDWLEASGEWKMLSDNVNEPVFLMKTHVDLGIKTNSKFLKDSGIYYQASKSLERFVPEVSQMLTEGKSVSVN
tara:strand:+ start:6727 stop:7473 length:747 start_codon:yes stop_codon:yes gene_type:complete